MDDMKKIGCMKPEVSSEASQRNTWVSRCASSSAAVARFHIPIFPNCEAFVIDWAWTRNQSRKYIRAAFRFSFLFQSVLASFLLHCGEPCVNFSVLNFYSVLQYLSFFRRCVTLMLTLIFRQSIITEGQQGCWRQWRKHDTAGLYA